MSRILYFSKFFQLIWTVTLNILSKVISSLISLLFSSYLSLKVSEKLKSSGVFNSNLQLKIQKHHTHVETVNCANILSPNDAGIVDVQFK